MEIRIPDCWLRGRSATTRILVEQEAKYVEQEKDRHNIQIGKKTLEEKKNIVKYRVVMQSFFDNIPRNSARERCVSRSRQPEMRCIPQTGRGRRGQNMWWTEKFCKRKLTWWYTSFWSIVYQTEMHKTYLNFGAKNDVIIFFLEDIHSRKSCEKNKVRMLSMSGEGSGKETLASKAVGEPPRKNLWFVSLRGTKLAYIHRLSAKRNVRLEQHCS